MLIKIILLLALILINGVLSASEIAFISLDKYTLDKDKNKKIEKIKRMKTEEGKFLSTIQVGITLAGFLASAFASDTFTDYLMNKVGIEFVNFEFTESVLMIVITLILSYVTLIFGELVPKQIGRSNPKKIAFLTIDFITLIANIFYPIIILLTKTTEFICKMLGIQDKEDNLTEEDIKNLIISSTKEGIIEEKEKEYILNIFKFNDKKAYQIMTKAKDIVSIDINDSKKDILSKIKNSHFTRFPVLDKEEIIGFINVKDLIYMHRVRGKFNIMKCIHSVLKFEKNVMIDDIFRIMQENHETFSVIVKDNKLVGLLTMEDAIEEIMGNISDEYN